MSKIAVVTDSTANLPRKWVEQYQVHVVPLKVHWGEETYRDGVDITVDCSPNIAVHVGPGTVGIALYTYNE
jgi:fatty acid-binding protein DegV